MAQFEQSAAKVTALVARLDANLQRRFILLMRRVRDDLTLEQVAVLLATGNTTEALALMQRAAQAFAVAAVGSFVLAAQDTASLIAAGLQVEVVFDQTHSAAVQFMRDTQLNLSTAITDEQSRALRVALVDGITAGLNPREQARLVRQSIGLTATQTRAVTNYRSLLERSSSEALRRQLRDRRFDRTVERAVSGEATLTQAQIERMVNRYAERMLNYRAQQVAHHAALQAVHAGSAAAFDQVVERGDLRADEIEQTWITAADERVRGSHSPMFGQERPHGAPFVSGAGNLLRFPGDPSAPLSETMRCRCAVTTRVRVEERS